MHYKPPHDCNSKVPTGEFGLQAFPNMVQSYGFAFPFNISPQIHSLWSSIFLLGRISLKVTSALYLSNSLFSLQPLSLISPSPLQLKGAFSKYFSINSWALNYFPLLLWFNLASLVIIWKPS